MPVVAVKGKAGWLLTKTKNPEDFTRSGLEIAKRWFFVDIPALKLKYSLGGGVKYFLFSPLFGEDSHFD